MNLSTSELHTSDTGSLGIAYTVVSLSVVVANGVIMYVIARSNELHMNAMWMLTFRALVDFAIGLYYLIFVVPSAFLSRFAYPANLIEISFCILSFLTGQTLFNIALTVIERCIAITRPLAYVRIVTKKNFLLGVGLSIVLGIVRLFLIVFPEDDFYYAPRIALCIVGFSTLKSVIASVIIPFITFITIVITSCFIAVEMRRGRRRLHPMESEAILKFPIMVMISVGVFCLSYVPFIVSVILVLIEKKKNVPTVLAHMTTIAQLSNSLWNVFIYTATYRPFREALLRLMCPNYHRQQRRAEIQVP